MLQRDDKGCCVMRVKRYEHTAKTISRNHTMYRVDKNRFTCSKDEQINLENVKPPKKRTKIKYSK